ncbi:MAG: hypothetical protein WC374_06470 [Phycisphaerae bacterium]
MKKNVASGNLFRMTGLFVFLFCVVIASAVTSKVTHQSTAEEFLKGEANDVMISSKGTMQLGRESERLTKDFNDVWSINCVAASGGDIYIGTSPNGGVYRCRKGKTEEIYSAVKENSKEENPKADANEISDSNDTGEIVAADELLANEHIFAMAVDKSGKLLVGISGRRCALCRLDGGKLVTLYEPNDAMYIFDIKVADNGEIYLATGPQGKIYQLNSAGKKAKVLYDSTDKNILSLAIANEGTIIAGSDTRGLVYKIDVETGSVEVLYDTEQPEVTSVLVTPQGDIYASATSAQMVAAQKQFAQQIPLAGRPEVTGEQDSDDENETSGGSMQLKIANTKKTDSGDGQQERASRKLPKPDMVSHIYKISADGFVTDVFAQAAVLFTLDEQNGQLLLGTGNEGELFTIDPASEDSAVIYKDEQASQITAMTVVDNDIYIGTANPAKLIKIGSGLAKQGTFTSGLVDAAQPADWGKLQIDADIPRGTKVMAASRSGNVGDMNDATFSQWTEAVEIDGPVQLRCPMGRFCQYKLILSGDGSNSPVVREVAVSSVIPNLAPNVKEVTVTRNEEAEKQGWFKISYSAQDDNSDTLVYTIDFRRLGRQGWIELEKDIGESTYEWDGRTVEDGRYEIRVTANDGRSNSVEKTLANSRVSEPVVVDNTAPAIEIDFVSVVRDGKAEIEFAAFDELSAIDEVSYTVDSSKDWKKAIPNDLVYDTLTEEFTIVLEDLKAGEHVLAIRAKDSVGNTAYKSIELNAK